MTDKKISQLTALPEATNDDLLVIVDDPSGSPETKHITLGNLRKDILNTTPKTSNYTATANDGILYGNATSGSFTFSLPTATSTIKGLELTFVKADSSANTITIDPDGVQTINGAANYVLYNQYQIVTVYCDGSNWQIKSSGGDVVGPGSSTDNALVRFDGTTGKLIQNSNATLTDGGTLDVANAILDYLQIDTAATPPTLIPGTLAWDSGNGTLELGLAGGNVTLRVGEQQYTRVYNDTVSTMTKGQVVYINGAQGNRVSVRLARANSEATSKDTIGLVAESITAGGEGWVINAGSLYNLNTNSLVAGDTVYLSPTTAGDYTTTKPTAPDHTVILGFVQRVHATVGSLYLKVDNGYEIDELHDVLISSPINGDLLQYQLSGLWQNSNLLDGGNF